MNIITSLLEFLLNIWKAILSPFTFSEKPIKELLGEQSPYSLTERWYEAKLHELDYVGLTSALLAGLFGSAFTWPAAERATWSVLACWYAGLMFVIASIASATQQSIMLRRLQSHPNHLAITKHMLGPTEPRLIQMFIWQIPVMMLRFGVYLFLAGLTILLWNTAHQESFWISGDCETAIVFLSVAAFALICHALSVYSSYLSVELGLRNHLET